MQGVAKHINEMKRVHEKAVYVQVSVRIVFFQQPFFFFATVTLLRRVGATEKKHEAYFWKSKYISSEHESVQNEEAPWSPLT